MLSSAIIVLVCASTALSQLPPCSNVLCPPNYQCNRDTSKCERCPSQPTNAPAGCHYVPAPSLPGLCTTWGLICPDPAPCRTTDNQQSCHGWATRSDQCNQNPLYMWAECACACTLHELPSDWTTTRGCIRGHNDLGGPFRSESVNACVNRCARTPGCKSVEYTLQSRSCNMQTASSASAPRSFSAPCYTDSATSTTILAERRAHVLQDAPTTEVGLFIGWDIRQACLKGHNLPAAYVSSMDECIVHCDKNVSGCASVEWRVSDGQCSPSRADQQTQPADYSSPCYTGQNVWFADRNPDRWCGSVNGDMACA